MPSLPCLVNIQKDEEATGDILSKVPFIENDRFKKILLKHVNFKEEHFIKGM